MLLELSATLAVFLGTVPGLAWPLARRLPLDAAEKITVSAGLSLLAVFLIGWTVYVAKLPVALLWILPVAGVVGLGLGGRSFAETLREVDARALVVGQALVTAWCLGWLAHVSTYSGGGWAADWFEHWERARFFIERGPPDTIFIGHATLTARPPLANVVVGAFMALVRLDFAVYQIVSTLLASLVFLPVALLARRFRESRDAGEKIGHNGPRAIALCAIFVMVNPLFVQNATFAWTKLPAAFFALAGLYFFLRAVRAERPAIHAALCAALLGAGLLAHYSVGPYVLLLVGGWLVVSWQRRTEPTWWRATLGAVLAGGGVLATWFAWSLSAYGTRGTLLANTSVLAADTTPGGQLARMALNVRDTVVPYFLRSFDQSLIAQTGAWGAWRDAWFQLYQVNLLFAFGSVAWLVLGMALFRAWRAAPPGNERSGWAAFACGSVLLGVAVHGARDLWGLAHICLQPLVLLGLAFIAARWPRLSRGWQRLLIAGAVVDFCLGIALHFAVQHLAYERWVGPKAFAAWQANATEGAVMNMAAKLQHKLQFFGDVFVVPPVVVVTLLLALAACAIVRTRAPRPEIPPAP